MRLFFTLKSGITRILKMTAYIFKKLALCLIWCHPIILYAMPEDERGIKESKLIKIELTQEEKCDTLFLDLGYALFNNTNLFLLNISIDKKNEQAFMMFSKKSDYAPGSKVPKIDHSNNQISEKVHFSVKYYRRFRIKVGQIVSLKGTKIKVRLLEVIGGPGGCYVPTKRE